MRYALTREEEFLTITKHKVVTKIKTAIKNGAITARKCEVFWDTGAYAEIGPRIGHKSGYTSAGPYRFPTSGSIPTAFTPTTCRPAPFAASAFRK